MQQPNIEAVPGVFALICTATNEKLVGHAQDVQKRCNTHLHDLRRRKHFNLRLQALFDEYGDRGFEVELLERLDDQQDRLDAVARYIDTDEYSLTLNPTPQVKPFVEKTAGTPRKKLVTFVTPWGEFESAKKAARACPANEVFYKWIDKACRYPTLKIELEDYKTSCWFIGFFETNIIGKTFGSMGFGAVYA